MLGPTLMHEHVFILDPGALASFGTHFGPSYWDEEVRVADAIAALRRLREAGIESIVDPTAYGLGRDIRRIQRVNEGVDLNIVVATGVYAFVELPGFLGYRTDDWIVDLFVHELREGIGDTGVRAAFLKCAVDRHGLVGDVPRILSLVGAAAVETDAPVMVHTHAATRTGLVGLDTLVRAGVDPRRVVIAHAGDSNDLDYLRALADTGASLGCDRFNIEHFNPDEDRIQTLVALVDAGYADRIHLGHDAATFHDFMVGNPLFAEEHADYLHLSTRILPRLLAAGITQHQLDQMLVENPRRFFA
jgi:phosphotriesterase-related protein